MDAIDHGEEVLGSNPTPMLFNDVYFSRCENITPTWAPFPRLPAELRLHIWLLYLRQHRMIEVDLWPTADNGDSRHYTDRNHLGRIVSGQRYTFRIRGRGSYATTLSSLFRVNQEARGAALSFYHIHLPFRTILGREHTKMEQILYLSSEYDVVYVRPQEHKQICSYPGHETILVDFLHDARVYDYKDQGIAHLAMDGEYRQYLFEYFSAAPVYLTPESLHPVAATSFTDILRHKLRSVLFVIRFRFPTRGMGALPMDRWRYHFAQTFPLRRRGHPTGAFHWFDVDPRPGVELDLRQLPITTDPQVMSRGWRQLEHAFGITRKQQAARENDPGGFRIYICPTQRWPNQGMLRMNGTATVTVGGEEEAEEVWSRDELAQHLQYETEDWIRDRKSSVGMIRDATRIPPKYSYQTEKEAETFEDMEKLPCTAIGMWLFPPEAFQPATCTNPQIHCFDVAAFRPGLFLFQV